jgi:hypothetical protein
MSRKGVDAMWYKESSGRYKSDDGRFLELEEGEWFGYIKGIPEAVFRTLKEGLQIIWK